MGVRRLGEAPTVADYGQEDDLFEEETVAAHQGTDDDYPAPRFGAEAGAAAKARVNKKGGYTEEFRFTEDPQVIRFTDDDNIGVYGRHWVQLPGVAGKRSYICFDDVTGLDPAPKRCPLCQRAGSKPETNWFYSIINFSHPDGPTKQLMPVKVRANNTVEAVSKSRRSLTSRFWSAWKTGKDQSTIYTLQPIDDDDIPDELPGITTERAHEIVNALGPLTYKDIRMNSLTELADVAQQMS